MPKADVAFCILFSSLRTAPALWRTAFPSISHLTHTQTPRSHLLCRFNDQIHQTFASGAGEMFRGELWYPPPNPTYCVWVQVIHLDLIWGTESLPRETSQEAASHMHPSHCRRRWDLNEQPMISLGNWTKSDLTSNTAPHVESPVWAALICYSTPIQPNHLLM